MRRDCIDRKCAVACPTDVKDETEEKEPVQ